MNQPVLEQESFTLELGDDLFIRGEVKANPKSGTKMPVLIVCHGFKAFKDWGFFPYLTSWFAERGYMTVHFNFSCNGVKEQDFDELDKFSHNTYSREQADLTLLLDALVQGKLPLSQYGDLSRIYLLGHSRGGGNSIIFAAEHEAVRAVATWNGIGSANLFDEEFESEAKRSGVAYTLNSRTKQNMPIHRRFFEDLEQNKARYNIPEKLAGLRIPVLIIQGETDSQRLLEGFQLLQSAAPEQHYVTIPGTGHTFGSIHPFAGPTEELTTALLQTHEFLKSI